MQDRRPDHAVPAPRAPEQLYRFEWDEDIEVYDEGWRVELANKSLGESYNALLNHIHLSPLINADYTVATGFGNETAFTTAPSGNELENIRLTLRQALQDAAGKEDSFGRRHPIMPTLALMNLATSYKVNDALSLIGDTSAIGASGGTGLFLGRQSDSASATTGFAGQTPLPRHRA